MAALRFGADTAERLEAVLAGVADPERVAEAGEWLVRCDTGDELLARATAAGLRDAIMTTRPQDPPIRKESA